MIATEELRRLLDERGVAWDVLQAYEGGEMTRWRDSEGRFVTAYDDGVMTFFVDFYWQPTAKQAIDATLGRGTCELVNAADDLGKGTQSCMCDACGYTALDDWWDEFKYCPNCGRKVVDE